MSHQIFGNKMVSTSRKKRSKHILLSATFMLLSTLATIPVDAERTLNLLKKSCALSSNESARDNDYQRDVDKSISCDTSSCANYSLTNERFVNPLDEDTEAPYAWRFKYLDEQNGKFDVQLIENSLDERLANIIYTVQSIRLVNIDSKRINSGDELRNSQLKLQAAGERVDHSKCRDEVRRMLDLYYDLEQIVESNRKSLSNARKLNESHIRLAQALDSFGHYDSGLMLGKSQFLGAHQQCLSTALKLREPESSEIRQTRFCFAKLIADKHLSDSLKSRAKPAHEADSTIDIGICLPETCHSISFNQHKPLIQQLINSQFKLPSMFLDQNLEFADLYCDIDKDSPLGGLPLIGKLFVVFVIIWLVLIAYATFGRSADPKKEIVKQGHPILKAYVRHLFNSMNIKDSWLDFVSAEKVQGSRVNLDALNPIKVVCSIVVVLGHTFMMNSGCPMDLTRAYNRAENDPMLATLLNATLVVDTFYVISGTLIAFITLRKFAGTKINMTPFIFLKQCFQVIGVRYLRLVPMYVLVFWFHKGIFLNFEPGPLTDSGYNRHTEMGSCRQESWLTPFTFLAAYQPLARQCMPHSWSIAGDIFFIIIIAPIIILMIRRPKLAAALSVVICCISNWMMFRSIAVVQGTLRKGLSELRYHSFVLMFANASHLYTAPHYRIFSVLIGVLTGFVLHTFDTSEEKGSRWLQKLRGPATKLSIGYIIFMFFIPGVVILTKDNLLMMIPLHHILFDASMTTGRLLWALSNAILFIRMTTEWKDSFMIKQASGTFWKALAKLSYCILLIHLDIIMYDMQSALTSMYFSRYRILSVAAFSYIACLVFSVVLHVLVENPIDKFIKGFINGLNRKYTVGAKETAKIEEIHKNPLNTQEVDQNHANTSGNNIRKRFTDGSDSCTRF